jgi:excisionase family DNA binding protein
MPFLGAGTGPGVQKFHPVGRFSEAFGPPVVHGSHARGLRPVPRPEEPFLTVREVARRLRVSRSTIYALCAEGRLPHARVSNALRMSGMPRTACSSDTGPESRLLPPDGPPESSTMSVGVQTL